MRQRGRVILRIVHFDSDGLWFKEDSVGNVTAITEEKAIKLVRAWTEHYRDAKASISGGLIHYLQTQEITNIEKRMQELKNEKSVAISGLVFCG